MGVRQRKGGGWPGWTYVLAAALLTGLCLVAARLWLPAVVSAGVAAGVAVVASAWATRGADVGKQRADRRRAAGWLVRLDGRGQLPLVSDLDDPVIVGVHPAAPLAARSRDRAPVFIGRDFSAELGEALLRDRFVLLIGESTAGKSRAAYEAMKALPGRCRLVEPIGRDGLPVAFEMGADQKECVLWLDDLERFVGYGGLTGPSVRNFLDTPGRARYIVATIRAQEHAKFSGGAALGRDEQPSEAVRHARDVLRLASEIRVSRSWSPSELSRAAQHRDDPRIASALQASNRFGLAEYLASGPQLLTDWRNGWAPGTHPRGAALVLAAVDARRAGIHRPLPLPVLEQLHEPYLRARGGDLLRPEALAAAMKWATTPLHATSSLLIPAVEETFLAFDYLIDSIEKDPIPAEVLNNLIACATPAEAMDIGETARDWGCLDQAEAAYRLAAVGGQRDATRFLFFVIAGRDGVPAALDFAGRELIERQEKLGPSHPDTFSARHLLISQGAFAERDADGNVSGAGDIVAQLSGLQHEAARALGEETRCCLDIRNGVAYWTLKAGDPSRAASLLSDLAAECARLLGKSDMTTLACRARAAEATGQAGNAEAAVRLYDQLVADTDQLHGECSGASLEVRAARAVWMTKAGRHDAATREWERLVSDVTASRGRLNDLTFAFRQELADCVGEGGNPEAAVQLLRQLITDASQVARPASLTVLCIHRSLARWTGEAGNPEEAARQMRHLADLSAQHRGEDDPETRALRQRTAEWTEKAESSRPADFN